MAITVTVRYNNNTRVPRFDGDVSTVFLTVAFSGTYPGGPPVGEAIDFGPLGLGLFREVWAVIPAGPAGVPLVPFADGVGVEVVRFDRNIAPASPTAGVLRLYNTGAALNANLVEKVAGVAYNVGEQVELVVMGRPGTDAS